MDDNILSTLLKHHKNVIRPIIKILIHNYITRKNVEAFIEANNIKSFRMLYNEIKTNAVSFIKKHVDKVSTKGVLNRPLLLLQLKYKYKPSIRDIKAILLNLEEFKDLANEELSQFVGELNFKKSFFDEEEGVDPRQFYLLKDKKDDIQFSSVSPYDFSEIRTSPLIVMGNEVLNRRTTDLTDLKIEDIHHQTLMDWYIEKHQIKNWDGTMYAMYDEGYNKYDEKNIGVGSEFGKVVLLEHIEGDVDLIKQVLINNGYKKVYVNNYAAWTSKEYKRIAKKRLFKKY